MPTNDSSAPDNTPRLDPLVVVRYVSLLSFAAICLAPIVILATGVVDRMPAM